MNSGIKLSSLQTVRVRQMGTNAYHPSATYDAQGTLWLAWISDIVTRRDSRGLASRMGNRVYVEGLHASTSLQILSHGTSMAARPVLFVHHGLLHCMWMDWNRRQWRLLLSTQARQTWTPPRALAGPCDFLCDPCVVRGPLGQVVVLFAEYRKGGSRIMLADLASGRCIPVSPPGISAYRPAGVFDCAGCLHLAWDCFYRGTYVVAAAQWKQQRLVGLKLFSQFGEFNGYPALASDSTGRVTLAWNAQKANREDRARMETADKSVYDGHSFPEDSRIIVRILDGREWKAPASALKGESPGTAGYGHFKPALAIDRYHRLWLARLHRRNYQGTDLYLDLLSNNGWADPLPVPIALAATGRGREVHGEPAFLPSVDAGRLELLATCWAGGLGGSIVLRALTIPGAPGSRAPRLVPAEAFRVFKPWRRPALRRRPVIRAAGTVYKVFWGETHGHCEFSFDATGTPDAWFHLARERYGLDFCVLTDHNKSLAQSALVFSLVRALGPSRTFLPLDGAETITAPPAVTDRVVLCLDRQFHHVYCLDRFGEPLQTVRQLHAAFRGTGNIIIPHDACFESPGNRGGICDRQAPDTELEPCVQLSTTHARPHFDLFEYYDPAKATRRYDSAFFRLSDALARGFRYGITGGSDCHESYPQLRAAFFLKSLTPTEIYRAFKARRAYAVTNARIFLDFRMNGKLMGSEMTVPRGRRRQLDVTVEGESMLSQVEIVRNGQVWHATPCASRRKRIHVIDPGSGRPLDVYYVRVRQQDGNMAWSSPVWVNSG